MGGDFPSAIEVCKKGVQTAQDPLFFQISNLGLGLGYTRNGQFQEAEEVLQEVASYSRDFGCEQCGTPAHAFLGLVSLSQGQMEQGLSMIEEALRACLENQRRCWYATIENALGLVYLQMNVPLAAKKAEEHFNRAIEVAKEIGAKGILGRVYLDLGVLHKAKGRKERAKECIAEAVNLFEQCEAEVYIKRAKEALENLG
jgi:tetratricopeptide (TPR) repeat protein